MKRKEGQKGHVLERFDEVIMEDDSSLLPTMNLTASSNTSSRRLGLIGKAM
jgi:hypothetical protein